MQKWLSYDLKILSKQPKTFYVIKDAVDMHCFCRNWYETAQEYLLFKLPPISLKQIEKFLHFSFRTMENFSNSKSRPSRLAKTRPSEQWERANPRGRPRGDGQDWNWLIHNRNSLKLLTKRNNSPFRWVHESFYYFQQPEIWFSFFLHPVFDCRVWIKCVSMVSTRGFCLRKHKSSSSWDLTFFMLPTYVETILMRWLHNPINNETLPKPIEWTLMTILSRNFKFDRHLSKVICMSAYPRLTNRFCYGQCFLNVAGGGWGCYSRKQLSIFQVGTLPDNPVSVEEFYKWHKFRPNKLF